MNDQDSGKTGSMKTAPAAEPANRARETTLELKMLMEKRSPERNLDAAAPAAAGRVGAAPAGPALPQAMVRLTVNDASSAPALIRVAVLRSGGSIAEEPGTPAQRLKTRIPAARQKELLDRLQLLGRITERPAPPPAGAQLLEMTIQW
jgi:hypothetical protein